MTRVKKPYKLRTEILLRRSRRAQYRHVDILLRRENLPAAIAVLEKTGFIHRSVASLGQTSPMDVFLEGSAGKVRDAGHIVFASEKIRPDQPESNTTTGEIEDARAFRLPVPRLGLAPSGNPRFSGRITLLTF